MEVNLEEYQIFKSFTEINAIIGDNQRFANQVKLELFAGEIYLYVTKSDIIKLPKGLIPIDFPYKIHINI